MVIIDQATARSIRPDTGGRFVELAFGDGPELTVRLEPRAALALGRLIVDAAVEARRLAFTCLNHTPPVQTQAGVLCPECEQ